MRQAIDYSGKKIGKLTVIERAENLINTYGLPVIQWKCICECGEIVYRKSCHIKRGRCKCKNCKALEDASRYGYNDIRQHHWYNIIKHAKKKRCSV